MLLFLTYLLIFSPFSSADEEKDKRRLLPACPFGVQFGNTCWDDRNAECIQKTKYRARCECKSGYIRRRGRCVCPTWLGKYESEGECECPCGNAWLPYAQKCVIPAFKCGRHEVMSCALGTGDDDYGYENCTYGFCEPCVLVCECKPGYRKNRRGYCV